MIDTTETIPAYVEALRLTIAELAANNVKLVARIHELERELRRSRAIPFPQGDLS